jgi:hypothetical protein
MFKLLENLDILEMEVMKVGLQIVFLKKIKVNYKFLINKY